MVTARQAFAGATVSDTIAAVLEREPDWSALPAATPPSIRRLLRRCLEKDPRRRLRDIGDARSEIVDARSSRQDGTTADRRVAPRTVATMLAPALLAAVGMAALACGGVARVGAIAAPRLQRRQPLHDSRERCG